MLSFADSVANVKATRNGHPFARRRSCPPARARIAPRSPSASTFPAPSSAPCQAGGRYSRAWRIVIRSAGTDCSLGLPKGRPDQANGGARQSTKDPGRDHSVMGGAIISESGGGIIPLRGATSSRNRGVGSLGISRIHGGQPYHPTDAFAQRGALSMSSEAVR